MVDTSGATTAGVPAGVTDGSRPPEAALRATARPWDRRCILAAAAVLAVYLLALGLLPRDVFWSPDEGAKVLQMYALGWQDGLRLQIVYPGQRLDPAFHFYPSWKVYPQPASGGSVALHWPIWFPALSLLSFSLLGAIGLYIIPMLAGLATAMLAGLLTWRFRPDLAPLAILLVGLATPVFFYSLLFWEHTLVAFLGLLALWQLLDLPAQRQPWRRLLVAGTCLLVATAFKTEMAIFSLCLAIAATAALLLYHRPQLRSWLDLGMRADAWRVAAVVVSLAALTWLLFFAQLPQAGQDGAADGAVDRLMAPEVASLLQRAPSTTATHVGYGLGDLAEGNLIDSLGRTWFYGFDTASGASTGKLGLAGVGLCLIGGVLLAAGISRNRGRVPSLGQWIVLFGAGLVFAGALQVLWFPERFRFVHAIFLPAPLVVLAFLFVPIAFRRWRYAGGLVALLAAIYLAVGTVVLMAREAYVPFSHPEWGARYVLPLYPLQVVCALVGTAEVIDQVRACPGRAARLYGGLLSALVIALAMVGVAFSLLGMVELRVSKRDLSAYQAVAEAGGLPVVTDLQWLPSALAPYYAAHQVYVVDGEHDLGQWLDQVGDGVGEFMLVGLVDSEPGVAYRSEELRERLRIQDQDLVHGLSFTEMRVVR